MIRAVLDTNVIVSGVIKKNGPPARILAALFHKQFISITSSALLNEAARVLAYPKIARTYRISPEQADAILSTLTIQSHWIQTPTLHIKASRDASDDVFLAHALHGNASFLVTGDNDLLQLKEFREVRIVSPELFLQVLKASLK